MEEARRALPLGAVRSSPSSQLLSKLNLIFELRLVLKAIVQFNDLTGRILNEATKNDTPIDAALSAIARALGLMISILAQRPGVSVEQLTKLSQDGVAEYARDALADIANKRGPVRSKPTREREED